ncbi:MAG: imidazolonepropionase [Chloroflexi bacterium UTCFX4]|jgi:imidazolonepropionase|nr:MAG: imidazolonepropionase [Chloroflexi bacterium UTCFX4]
MSISLIIHSASQLVTVAGDAPKRGETQSELGIIENGALAIRGQEIVAVGASDEIRALATNETELIDARGRIVLPGFVDAHTHVVFAGDRAQEFEMRLRGATYLELLKAGGGIMNTVRNTRAASLEQIVAETRARLDRMLAHGTTTVEAKTGYGLDTATELKMLQAIYELDASHPLDLIPTFIGAHAIPEEYKGRADEFVDVVVEEMLPAIRNSKFEIRNLFCDVFCDDGAFDLAQSRKILERARELGMPLKIHADEFANLGGAALAAELGAVSADHLMVTRRDEMKLMANANVIAVLLPGTTFGLGKNDFANGRAFVEENVPVALGSDMNPGTSWCESMPMAMAIATRYEKLTTAEAIVAATLNAAYASGVGERVGSLQVGKLADVLIADVPDYRYLAYRYGANPIRMAIKRGRVVYAI